MTNDELLEKMLAFIDLRDGDRYDEWYATPRDFAATILTDFAAFLGEDLVVPAYVPQVKRVVIDRAALLRELLPGTNALFNIQYDATVARIKQEGS